MEELTQPKPFNWAGHVKNIVMALVLFMGGGAGSYVANSEMMDSQMKFQKEVTYTLEVINRRLDKLEDRP